MGQQNSHQINYLLMLISIKENQEASSQLLDMEMLWVVEDLLYLFS